MVNKQPSTKELECVSWIVERDNEVIGSFNSRADAVSWLKKILKQTLIDFEKQDIKNCEYDYEIRLGGINIYKIIHRLPYLGL
jgi:hypothetical protein